MTKVTINSLIVDIKCIKCTLSLDINDKLIAKFGPDNRAVSKYDWMHSRCYDVLNDNDINQLRSLTST